MRISKAEIRLLRSLAQKKVRERERKFLIEGWKPLKDALDSDYVIEFVAVTPQQLQNPEHGPFVTSLKSGGLAMKELTEIELRQVSDTVHAQGIVALVRQKTESLDEVLAHDPKLVVLADHIADPGNLGTIVRTCDWFDVGALILSDGCVDLYNEKVIRSTSGSIFHLPITEGADLISVVSHLQSTGFRCFATSGDAEISYREAAYGPKNAIVFGSEAAGVDPGIRALVDSMIGVPREGRAESLNVGVACGIVLAHLRQRG